MANDEQLLADFGESFAVLDYMIVGKTREVAPELQAGGIDDFERWRPTRQQTDPAMLVPLYQLLPSRFRLFTNDWFYPTAGSM